jgi:hypothetical protein
MKDVEEQDHESSVEVTEMKHKAHQTAVQADKDIKKLNRLLRANGITLKIYIAGGGHHK